MKNIFLVLVLALLTSCTVKPPEDGDALGDEATYSDVATAFEVARTGYDQDKLFRVGDYGQWQIVQRVLNNKMVQEIHDLSVTQITKTSIIYVDSIQGGNSYQYEIARTTPQKTAFTTKILNLLPSFLSSRLAVAFAGIDNFFSKISFERSTAVGSEMMISRPPAFDTKLLTPHLHIQSTINSYLGRSDAPVLMRGLSAQEVSEKATSRYYGLKYYKHPFQTNNCAQLADCKVNATHIQFNEVTQDSSGKEVRIHRIYEISLEVPGLFTFLEECMSMLVKQDDSDLPITQCFHVEDFRFGAVKPN
jgi:hypothetical protein